MPVVLMGHLTSFFFWPHPASKFQYSPADCSITFRTTQGHHLFHRLFDSLHSGSFWGQSLCFVLASGGLFLACSLALSGKVANNDLPCLSSKYPLFFGVPLGLKYSFFSILNKFNSLGENFKALCFTACPYLWSKYLIQCSGADVRTWHSSFW